MSTDLVGGAVTTDELRRLFLFESLEDDRLAWLASVAERRHAPAGSVVFQEGEPATDFVVLLEGEVSMVRAVRDAQVEIARTSQVGVYAGATQAYLGDRAEQVYIASLRAVTDTTLVVLPAEVFATAIRDWYPLAMHLLEGLFLGMRSDQVLVGQRERLQSLGALTAGLTHELNNPAAAAVRAVASLRDRVAGMRHKLALLAAGDLEPEQLARLTELQERIVERARAAPRRSALQASQAEDELLDWFDDHGIGRGWDLAPVWVIAGLGADCADEVAATVDPRLTEGAFRWITYTLETEQLMTEISDSVTRISTLVGAARQYSQMDRSEHQVVDLRDGLDSTLLMLGARLKGATPEESVEVVRDYDPDLPRVPAYAAELNQVWTNLVDNAVDAMDDAPSGRRTLTVSTRVDGDAALVEIADTGVGIPADVRSRIFDPFFSTKAIGHGTGLGLDISWRIVVNRHGGDLRVVSEPGDTRFQVRLPFTAPSP